MNLCRHCATVMYRCRLQFALLVGLCAMVAPCANGGSFYETPTPQLPVPEETWKEDPLQYFALDMSTVIEHLKKGETHRPVTTEQPRLLSRMDALIKELEEAMSKSSSGASGTASATPTIGAQDSTLAPGPGGRGKMRETGKSRREWAALTPKERDKILQSRADGFPPEYEDLLQEYFLQLSQETAGEQVDETENGDKVPAVIASEERPEP